MIFLKNTHNLIFFFRKFIAENVRFFGTMIHIKILLWGFFTKEVSENDDVTFFFSDPINYTFFLC